MQENRFLYISTMDNLEELRPRVVRKVYLITYARADAALCGTRENFATMVIDAFNFGNGTPRLYIWSLVVSHMTRVAIIIIWPYVLVPIKGGAQLSGAFRKEGWSSTSRSEGI